MVSYIYNYAGSLDGYVQVDQRACDCSREAKSALSLSGAGSVQNMLLCDSFRVQNLRLLVEVLIAHLSLETNWVRLLVLVGG